MANKTGGKFFLFSKKRIVQKGKGQKKIKLSVNRNTKVRVKRG